MSRKSQQILIVTAILMTVALLMVFVGGMGVGEPEADSVEIYLNEIDTLVAEKPAGEDASSRLDSITERLKPRTAETQTVAKVAPKPESNPIAVDPVEAQKQAVVRTKLEARQEVSEQTGEEAVAIIDDTVIDDTQEEPKAKKEKPEGKPSKIKEVVKSYAKRIKPILEARGLDLSDLEGRSPTDQVKAVGKKLIEAIRANGGSIFGA